METRLQHENFRSRQSSAMVRRSHITMEFIGVATGNGHCASDKLIVIRHKVCDIALVMQGHALDSCTTKHSAHNRVVLS